AFALCASARQARAESATEATTRAAHTLPKLRIHLLEVARVHEHFARLAAGAGRDQPLGLHHVHQPRCPAEPDPQLPLQIRDGRLAGADDDARRFIVEFVLLELDTRGTAFLVLGRDRVIEDRLALLAQEAGQPGALLLG